MQRPITGNLQEKKGFYYISLNIYSNGKRKPKSIPTGLPVKGNKNRAKQMLMEAITKYSNEEELRKENTPPSFSDCVRSWLSEVKYTVDPVTYEGYEEMARNHVIPYADAHGWTIFVTREQLQSYINEKYEHGRLDGKGGLKPRSMKKHKNVLYQTLKLATLENVIPSNPAQFVTVPSIDPSPSQFLNKDEIDTLLDKGKGDPIYLIVKLTIVYGLRRSEVLGLQWDSIDFGSNMIYIKHTQVKKNKIHQKDRTKNRSSHRSFPLLKEIKSDLLNLKAQEEFNRKLCGKSYHENPYLFKWEDGTPIRPDYLSRHFHVFLRNCGVRQIRFHDLRHSCASFLLNSGFNLKDVSEWLGHSDISVTADIYGHLDIQRKMKTASAFEKAFLADPDSSEE